ncbi:MAG: hypothetical protein EOM50_00245 [Erysipelotrichia bacterium]|nr:hypothetical protein [Erysipelotrichia bacterium]NCC55088.1 hypothetical protein [Erysipelotrichia bacterium]
MRYAPKAKRKINLKIMIPLLVIVSVIVTFGVQNLLLKKEEGNTFKICDLTYENSKKALEKKFEKTYSISDYHFYGESLNLYHDTYNIETTDDLAGKSVILKDICSQKEYSYVIRNSIDSQILLANISEGYYEVYVVEDLIEKRVVFNGTVNTNITTLKRNNRRLAISLLADMDYFRQQGIEEKENYLYLVAKKAKNDDEVYDIAIDPGAYDYDFTWTVNKGAKGHDLVEYEQTYLAAQLLKEKLEAKGLKVLLVRNEKEDVNSYGKDGRLQRAYNAHAKYYIKLSFDESDLNYEGMEIRYSAHANGAFSKQIIYYLSKNTEVKLSSIYNTSDPGNVQVELTKGMDNRYVYDLDLAIREAGGKATQAGMYSENAQEGTAFFAKDNVYGMNAIRVYLGYLTSASDVEYWQNHKEEYMNAIAEGMVSYFNLNQES